MSDRHAVRVDRGQRAALVGTLTELMFDAVCREVAGRLVEVCLGANFEAQMLGNRRLALLEQQGVMLPFFDTAQVEGVLVGVFDNEAKRVGIKGTAATKIGNAERNVTAAHDVEGRREGVLRDGHLNSQDGRARDGAVPRSLAREEGPRIFVARGAWQC
jgi:hypothetical protein